MLTDATTGSMMSAEQVGDIGAVRRSGGQNLTPIADTE